MEEINKYTVQEILDFALFMDDLKTCKDYITSMANEENKEIHGFFKGEVISRGS